MSSLKTKRGEECIIDSHGDVVCKVRMDKLCVKLPFCPFYNSMKDNVPHSIFPFFSLFRFYLETFTLRFHSEISIRSLLLSVKNCETLACGKSMSFPLMSLQKGSLGKK